MKAKATVIRTDGYSTGDNVGVMGIKTTVFFIRAADNYDGCYGY
jgi:hypothetical protein